MKTLSKIIVTLTVPMDFTEYANELILEGEIKTIDELKKYFTGIVCEDLTMHLLQWTDVVSDLNFEIEEE